MAYGNLILGEVFNEHNAGKGTKLDTLEAGQGHLLPNAAILIPPPCFFSMCSTVLGCGPLTSEVAALLVI